MQIAFYSFRPCVSVAATTCTRACVLCEGVAVCINIMCVRVYVCMYACEFVCVCVGPTLAEWFGSIPGAVLGAHQRGGAVGVHVEPR